MLFTLIKLGLFEEFEQYKQLCESKIHLRAKKSKKEPVLDATKTRKSSKSESTRRSSAEMSEEDSHIEKQRQDNILLDNLYHEIEENIEAEKVRIIDLLHVKKHAHLFKGGVTTTFSTSKCFQDLFKVFLREGAAAAKCPHCNSKQPTVRKEGHAKILLSSIDEKTKISKVLHTGVDSDDSNEELDLVEEEDEDVDAASVAPKKSKKAKILHPFEVRENIRLLFEENSGLMNVVFGNIVCNQTTIRIKKKGYEIIKFHPDSFFLEVLPVSPNRFRPENKLSDSTYLHAHTTILQKILTINYELKTMLARAVEVTKSEKKAITLNDTISKWIELQETVNSLYDSSKTGKLNTDKEVCIKQLLEKKEGIFRMKIMGKRVNFAARSVISPDPNLDTNEVGVPLFMAKKLTFPEGVNEANYEKLKQLILNGPSKWPGAVSIEENGNQISLEGSTKEQREAIARSLLENAENKVVYRHLMNKDVLLFNRQPTLHKPSLMSHIARVLPSEQTIRMHYANCSGYNADFDGDEMNLHFLQNHVARAEAYNLSICDKQYILPTNKGPIRGLIQDIILSAVFITMQNTFFEKSEYNQLIYTSLRTLIESDTDIKRLKLLPPAILKPRQIWTGKQVVSTIISIIAEREGISEKLYMTGKGKIDESHLSEINKKDSKVIVQGNELLTGIIDKNSIGATPFGLVHCFYELTDSARTGKLLSGLSRLFCNFLQMHGFTCSLDDLQTTPEFEIARKSLLDKVFSSGVDSLADKLGVSEQLKYRPEWYFFGRDPYESPPEVRLRTILKRKPGKDYLSETNSLSHEIGRRIVTDRNLALIDSEWKG